MIDIRLIRENKDAVLRNLEKRHDREKMQWLDIIERADGSCRKLDFDAQNLRRKRNEATESIAKLLKAGKGKDAEKAKEGVKRINDEISLKETEMEGLKAEIEGYLMRLPNILHDSVPVGKSEEDNVEIRKWGAAKKPDFKVKSHVDILQDLDLADIERAGKISGARFYFLKKELVLLDLALARFALDMLVKKGFIPMLVPYMIRKEPYQGVTDLADFENVLYKIENEDLYLIATSEHAIGGMRMNEIMLEKELPLKYAGFSACFRKEAGAHGKDTKGIFRVHQFHKVEQFVFSKPEESWKIHEELIKNAEDIFQALGLPYRIVNVCTGDIGTVAAKKYDLEVWMPAQGKYREAVSCSNCTDYQSRRLNIRYGIDGEKAKGHVHTLNATAMATTRAIAAILENFQTSDGKVEIPKALQPYMGGVKVIGRN
ncbi:MAG: serine--tRNA ligase [Candidatus Aenigmarchaeota archaeon]|nr:serine--tRNA ligase [Candidatus Aenigmarchaeota archaeon]